MLCNIYNDDINEDDELKCSICNEFFHFGCVALREWAFQKMLKIAKQKWGCIKRKFTNDSKTKPPVMNIKKRNEASGLTNELFRNLTDSLDFMSEKFDAFGNQLQELLQPMKDMRGENRILKEQNNTLRNDFNTLSIKLNILEQKLLDNFVEIVNVSEINDED